MEALRPTQTEASVTSQENTLFYDAPDLLDKAGKLIPNLYKAITAQDQVALAFPQVTRAEFAPIEAELKEIANAESLDLTVRLMGQQGEEPVKIETGWNDGNRVRVDVFLAKAFTGVDNPSEYFENEIAPKYSEE